MIRNLISTIIPVYNRPDLLVEAVASVLEQEYRPIEVIIVDDGSTDERTPIVAKQLLVENPGVVSVIAQENAGPGAARERGRQRALGEYIQYLDSDDVLLPGKFEAQVRALQEHLEADVAYGITYLADAAGVTHEIPHKETGRSVRSMFPGFLVSRWWETATPLYRATVCTAAGPWTSLRLEEDWEYDCRIASLGGSLVWCPIPVSVHRDHGGSRLSRGKPYDSNRLRDRAKAHELVLGHALRFGMTSRSSEMQSFSRSLFLLARHCGAAGLSVESQRLFDLSRQAAGEEGARRADYRIYAVLASVLGWTAMGRASAVLDSLRRRG